MELTVGLLVADRYRLEEKIGEGGMAVVWAARHLVTGKSAALKFLLRDHTASAEVRARFLREARAASMVDHPAVVAIHDVMELPDHGLVMVMDRLVGETLRDKLERERSLGLTQTAEIMLPVISAVGSAHAAGVVHRDLKPDNIFLCRAPAGVRVLDFGIAKLTGAASRSGKLTATGSVLGTPYYMAPEQVFGERDIDARADVWAVGVILYECLSGLRPFEGDNPGQILKAILGTDARPLGEVAPGVPPALSDLLGQMLDRRRQHRPADLSGALRLLSEHSRQRVRSFGPARGPLTILTTAGGQFSSPFTATAPDLSEAVASTTTDGDAGADAPSAATSRPAAFDTAVPVETWGRSRRRRGRTVMAAVAAALLVAVLIGWGSAGGFGPARAPFAERGAALGARQAAERLVVATAEPSTSASTDSVEAAAPTVSAAPSASAASVSSAAAGRGHHPRRPALPTGRSKAAGPAGSVRGGKLPAGVYGDVPF